MKIQWSALLHRATINSMKILWSALFHRATITKHLRGAKLDQKFKTKLECGPMPNVMVALPNIGGSLCSTPQSLADAHY